MNFTKSTVFRIFTKIPRYHLMDIGVPRVSKQLVARMATNVSVSPSQHEKDMFHEVLPTILESIVSSHTFTKTPDIGNWVKKVLDYNLRGGKNNRGLATILAYKMLERPENVTEDSLQLARIMGWCVEMLQAYLLVLDDIMDGSSSRRGMPCWYRVQDVGLGAINDSILIHTSIHHVLNAYFRNRACYTDVLDLFNETLTYTSIGQHLDYMMAHRNKNDYSQFTRDQYDAIVTHKTAYYTYKLPVSLGLYLSGNMDAQAHRQAEDICLDIGNIFQIQDDFIDCYSDESVSGKIGTDIQEGKCSWLAVTALQRCNSPQRVVFETCYGSKQPAHVERIKQLYNTLEMPKLYKEEEAAAYERITTKIKRLPESLSPPLFYKLIEMIYDRKG